MAFDPMADINWDEVEVNAGPVPDGEYDLIAQSATLSPTKDGEGVQVKVMWVHAEPQFSANSPINDYIVWKPQLPKDGSEAATKRGKLLGMTKGKLTAIFGEVVGPEVAAASIKGRSVHARIKSEEYDRKDKEGNLTGEKGTSNKIDRYLS